MNIFFDDIPHGQGSWNVRFDAGCTLLINVGCQMRVVIFSQLPKRNNFSVGNFHQGAQQVEYYLLISYILETGLFQAMFKLYFSAMLVWNLYPEKNFS